MPVGGRAMGKGMLSDSQRLGVGRGGGGMGNEQKEGGGRGRRQ